MYSEYARLNVQTWIIGPALGGGPLMERPADMLKVWPVREPLYRQPPAPFNAMLDRLTSEHCRVVRYWWIRMASPALTKA